MNNTKRNEKGFTMVELIIVVAIMGIIGALLVPAFGAMSTKARLTTDLSSVKTLKRTVDSYKAELGSYPADGTLTELNDILVDAGYLDAAANSVTPGANISYSGGTVKLDLTNMEGKTEDDTSKAISTLVGTANNADYIMGN